jgi:hypothetical protein
LPQLKRKLKNLITAVINKLDIPKRQITIQPKTGIAIYQYSTINAPRNNNKYDHLYDSGYSATIM